MKRPALFVVIAYLWLASWLHAQPKPADLPECSVIVWSGKGAEAVPVMGLVAFSKGPNAYIVVNVEERKLQRPFFDSKQILVARTSTPGELVSTEVVRAYSNGQMLLAVSAEKFPVTLAEVTKPPLQLEVDQTVTLLGCEFDRSSTPALVANVRVEATVSRVFQDQNGALSHLQIVGDNFPDAQYAIVVDAQQRVVGFVNNKPKRSSRKPDAKYYYSVDRRLNLGRLSRPLLANADLEQLPGTIEELAFRFKFRADDPLGEIKALRCLVAVDIDGPEQDDAQEVALKPDSEDEHGNVWSAEHRWAIADQNGQQVQSGLSLEVFYTDVAGNTDSLGGCSLNPGMLSRLDRELRDPTKPDPAPYELTSTAAAISGSGRNHSAALDTTYTAAKVSESVAGYSVEPEGIRVTTLNLGKTQYVNSVPWSSQGDSFFLLTQQGILRSIAAGNLTEEYRLDLKCNCVSFGLARDFLVIVPKQSKHVLLVDPTDLEVKGAVAIPGVSVVACSPQSNTFYALSKNWLFVADAEERTINYRIPGQLQAACVTEDGEHLMLGRKMSPHVSRCRIAGASLQWEESTPRFQYSSVAAPVTTTGHPRRISVPFDGPRLFDVTNLRQPLDVRIPSTKGHVAVDPVSGDLFVHNGAELLMLDPSGSILKSVPIDGFVQHLSVSPKGKSKLVALSWDSAYWIDLDPATEAAASGNPAAPVTSHQEEYPQPVESQRSLVASGITEFDSAKAFEISFGKEDSIPFGGFVTAAVASPDGKFTYVLTRGPTTFGASTQPSSLIQRVRNRDFSVLQSLDLGTVGSDITLSSAGLVVAAGARQRLYVIEPSSLKVKYHIDTPLPHTVVGAPTSPLVFASKGRPMAGDFVDRLSMIDVLQRRTLAQVTAAQLGEQAKKWLPPNSSRSPATFEQIAMRPDGKRLLVADGPSITSWAFAEGELKLDKYRRVRISQPKGIVCSPDSRYAIIVTSRGVLLTPEETRSRLHRHTLLDAKTLEPISTLECKDLVTFAFEKHGRVFALDRSARVSAFDTDGKQLLEFSFGSSANALTAIMVSPRPGKLLLITDKRSLWVQVPGP